MNNLSQSITNPFLQAWTTVVNYFPRVLGAIIIFFIGWLVSYLVSRVAKKIFEWVRVDQLLARSTNYTTPAGTRLSPSFILARIVFWFLMIMFLIAAAEALGLVELANFLRSVTAYIPRVFVAALILFAAFEFASSARMIIEGSLAKSGEPARAAGTVAWWVIVLFGTFAALVELRFAVSIVNIVAGGLVLMLAVAGGLAFGLGGRETAARILKHWEDRFRGERS